MMKWVAVTAGVLLLLYLTLSMAPGGPPPGASHTAEGAGAACQAEVSEDVVSGAFPLSPTVEYRGSERYAVRGVVDETTQGATVRRNYDCIVRYDGQPGYSIDSLSVWQSH